MNRRQLIQGAGIAVSQLMGNRLLGCGQHAAEDPFSGEALYRDVLTYTEFGEHPTGTHVDRVTGNWLAARLREAGVKPTEQPFSFNRFELFGNYLEVSGERVDSFPVWFPMPTANGNSENNATVSGPLALLNLATPAVSMQGQVALVQFNDANVTPTSNHAALIEAAASRGAVAVVGCGMTRGEAYLAPNVDTDAFQIPWPIPVLNIARKDYARVAAALGQTAVLSISGGEHKNGKATNIQARIERGQRLIIVSTPYSGWLRNGGERGPGIALFLAVAKWAAARNDTDVSYLFTANSGHEVGQTGMDMFMASGAPPKEQVLCWMHLGASIGIWQWIQTPSGLQKDLTHGGVQYLVGSASLIPLLQTSFAGVKKAVPRTSPLAGELADIISAGYTGFGFFGANYYMHAREDLADQTDPTLLEPIGRGIAAALDAIEKLP